MKHLKKRQLLALIVVGIVMAIGGLTLANSRKSSQLAKASPSNTPAPSPGQPGNEGDKAKENLSSPVPNPSPTQTTSPSPKNTYIETFSIETVSGGFHVISVLSGLANGSCSITISPKNLSSISKTGTVIVSGNTNMCDFGGNILGSGWPGTASLIVTAENGSTDQMSISYQ